MRWLRLLALFIVLLVAAAGDRPQPGDGVDQPDACHLNQVVPGLPATLEPAGDVIGQRQAALHDFVAMALEFRRVALQNGQLAEHVRNVSVFVGTR